MYLLRLTALVFVAIFCPLTGYANQIEGSDEEPKIVSSSAVIIASDKEKLKPQCALVGELDEFSDLDMKTITLTQMMELTDKAGRLGGDTAVFESGKHTEVYRCGTNRKDIQKTPNE